MTVERTEAAGAVAPASDVALETFVATHYDRLLGLARLVCRDAGDAADAVQIGLEQAWRKRASLREPDRTRAWVDRIVTREAVRISKGRRSWLARLVSPSPGVVWIDPRDSRATEPPTFAALRAAFGRLPADQRAAIALHLHLGYTVAETADLVGAPEETVRSRLRLAKERLRDELGDTDR